VGILGLARHLRRLAVEPVGVISPVAVSFGLSFLVLDTKPAVLRPRAEQLFLWCPSGWPS